MSRARDFADLAGAADAGGLTGRNLIINGAVNVHQRNADATTTDTFGPDRYQLQFTGGGTTMSHEDMTSSDTPYSSGFRNFLRIKNTTTTSGAGDYRQITYRLEAQDIANSGWDYTSTSAYMTVSFWVRSSVAGKFYFTLETGASGSDKYYGFSETLVADTWKKVEHSVPGNSTLTFANSNARGLGFIVRGWLGTNYTDSGFTEDTWGSFSLSSLAGDDLANWAGTTNSTLDVVGLQMEVGSQATPFEHRSYDEERLACYRYFFQFGSDGSTGVSGTNNNSLINYAYAKSTTGIEAAVRPPLPMRVQPTVTVSATGDVACHLPGFVRVPATALSTQDNLSGFASVHLNVTIGSNAEFTAGKICFFEFNGADKYLRMDAEL